MHSKFFATGIFLILGMAILFMIIPSPYDSNSNTNVVNKVFAGDRDDSGGGDGGGTSDDGGISDQISDDDSNDDQPAIDDQSADEQTQEDNNHAIIMTNIINPAIAPT
jgi:hypothetical protein